MAVTASMVKELRELTGAGMVDCKNALTQTDGDVKAAIALLREKGLAAAAKKAGRIAADGLVHTMISADGKVGAVVEVNSETDFVANNEEFRTFVDDVSKQVLKSKAVNVETFLNEPADFYEGSVQDALVAKIALIRENLTIRRFVRYELADNAKFYTYIHGMGKIAVLVELACDKADPQVDEAGKNICFQIAALMPQYVSKDFMPESFITAEKEIVKQQIINEGRAEGKPEAVVEKMIQGKLDKNLKEISLMDQQYVKDTDMTVAQYLEQVSKAVGSTVTVTRFACFEKGEGIEKKEENFAEEVSKAMEKK